MRYLIKLFFPIIGFVFILWPVLIGIFLYSLAMGLYGGEAVKMLISISLLMFGLISQIVWGVILHKKSGFRNILNNILGDIQRRWNILD
jgi:F0F1-type ATP synthase assembly protein I